MIGLSDAERSSVISEPMSAGCVQLTPMATVCGKLATAVAHWLSSSPWATRRSSRQVMAAVRTRGDPAIRWAAQRRVPGCADDGIRRDHRTCNCNCHGIRRRYEGLLRRGQIRQQQKPNNRQKKQKPCEPEMMNGEAQR